MNTIKVVVGSSLGDEGKGLMTDYYASQNPDAIVVRHDAGANAGHTVTTPDGKRHVFSHLSSGTFAGNETYLSSFFVVNPILFMKEHKTFVEQFGFAPKVTIHPSTYVTTPYDMLLNQSLEQMRGDNPHGSCGVGFGETLERVKRGITPIKLSSLGMFKESSFSSNLEQIRSRYVPTRIDLEQTSDIFKRAIESDDIIDLFFNSVRYMLDHVTIRNIFALRHKDLIFESAQGLLLDQDYGFFPHVTRSNTGMRNVGKILSQLPQHNYDIEVNYITRAYTTRHGAGPLDYEYNPGEIPINVVDETNVPNEWQGTLRFAPLNLDTFNSITAKDFALYAPFGAKRVNTITCLDQVDDFLDVVENGKVRQINGNDFKEQIVPQLFDYQSYGPTRNDVRRS